MSKYSDIERAVAAITALTSQQRVQNHQNTPEHWMKRTKAFDSLVIPEDEIDEVLQPTRADILREIPREALVSSFATRAIAVFLRTRHAQGVRTFLDEGMDVADNWKFMVPLVNSKRGIFRFTMTGLAAMEQHPLRPASVNLTGYRAKAVENCHDLYLATPDYMGVLEDIEQAHVTLVMPQIARMLS